MQTANLAAREGLIEEVEATAEDAENPAVARAIPERPMFRRSWIWRVPGPQLPVRYHLLLNKPSPL